MFKQNDIVLVDTNVILEAHRIKCWKAIAEYFNLHTVSKVIEETQTGFQNRREEQIIDMQILQSSFSEIVDIDESQCATFDITHGEIGLHAGEKSLIIYAQSFTEDVWFLNSPDIAAVKYACSQNWYDKLVSLEAMTNHVRLRPQHPLAQNYTEDWLSRKKMMFRQQIL